MLDAVTVRHGEFHSRLIYSVIYEQCLNVLLNDFIIYHLLFPSTFDGLRVGSCEMLS